MCVCGGGGVVGGSADVVFFFGTIQKACWPL